MNRIFWEAAYSPDGQWLLARTGGLATVAGGRDVWALRPGLDSAPAPLVVTEFDEEAIALSPDGRWLAYESDETGRNEVYVRPFPAVTEGKWQVSTGGGVMPRWAHSGRELFYKSAGRFIAVPVTPGPTLTLGPPRVLISVAEYRSARNRQQYDVAPDDRHFVMIRNLPRSAGDVVYVEHWFPELQAKVGM